jgi:putative glutamine amidotransferase
MKIAITDNMGSEHKLRFYHEWLKKPDESLELVNLSYARDNLHDMDSCVGVVLTGGGDVDPELYHGQKNHRKLHGVDRKRDDFERAVIDSAIRHEMPFLGICRGLQIANVHFGGTLIQDLGEKGHPSHVTRGQFDQRHPITLLGNSLLHSIVGVGEGDVNSSHHQAAAKIGSGLVGVAKAIDGIKEALEFERGTYPTFFLLVQWHPERMNDESNPFCNNIRLAFLQSCKTFSDKKG